ncbi:MAG: phenylalanine--tRNA ligase subunit alpha, partial [Aquincola sp.]|nr:phenylalanine--tRNA ligase subunit alpha [Aquincola sp.]
MNDLDTLVQAAQADFAAATQGAALEDAKARFLGKSG